MSEIPNDLGRPFLDWLRDSTERAWHGVNELTLADYRRSGVGGASWRRGTRWTGGLDDGEIDAVEARFGVRFPPDHRLWLQVLHATAPRRFGASYRENTLEPTWRPGFYNWLDDEAEIRAASDEVVSGLVFDVEHADLWPASWGARPVAAADRLARVAELVARAPRLLPIFGHRHVLAEGPTIVLSVHQSDIIVHGRDLRAYALHELHDLLGLERDPSWMDASTADIPFWGELIG